MTGLSRSALNRIGLLEAVRRILQPLARAAARQGIPRGAFIAAATDSWTPAARRSSLPNERLSAKRPLDYALALRLVGRWLSHQPYSTAGHPRPLARSGRGSFEELAGLVGAESEPMLHSLRAVGAVRINRAGRIVLVDEAYIPARGLSEKLEILGRDAAEFVSTILHNLEARHEARLQRKASYDNIGERAVSGLRPELRKLAMQSLRDANRALARVDRDRNRKAPGGRRTRVSFGIYVSEERVSEKTTRRRRPKPRAQRPMRKIR
jgi:Family of unknown function (DUF6502)